MIDAASELISARQWESVKAFVMDSHSLQFADHTFTHSITNFSIFTFADALKCLQEIHRTVKVGGTAVVTTWKRFGVVEVIHQAQKAVRPDLPLMEVPHPEFLEKGYLARQLIEAGSEGGKMKVVEKSVVARGEDLDGLVNFMSGGFTAPARAGWGDDDAKRWNEALADAVDREKKEHGGIKMEAWVAIARK